mmetsp:Transcript_1415/g.1925  ORF Transcript_1415/g.1925 Transcript_1415/m.1925 type:complete len:291 (+) Transcript_1415:86-958(+)
MAQTTKLTDLGFFGSQWEQLYEHFQIFGLKIHVTVAAIILFSVINVSTHKFLVSEMGWPDGVETNRAAGFVVGFFHSSSLLPPLFEWAYCIGLRNLDIIGPWKSVTERNCLSSVMRFSLGYFFYDTLYNLIFMRMFVYRAVMSNAEWIFVAHHILCVVNFSNALNQPTGQKYQFYVWCSLLAEATNPLDNIMAFTKKGLELSPGPFLESIHYHSEFALSLLYFLFRGIILPITLPYVTYQFWKYGGGRGAITSVVGCASMWFIVLGGFPWVMHCGKVLRQRFEGSMDAEL